MNISKDLTGQKFGKLTAISKAESILGGNTVKRFWGTWNCQCDCGNQKIVKTVDLNKGSVRSCGCIIKEGNTTLTSGQKFSRLTTITYINNKWSCICECGEYTEVPSYQLVNGNTKSCGCLKTEIASQKAYKLIAGRRLNEPRIASARRVWQSYCQRDKKCTITIENFLLLSQQNCFYCGIQPNTKYNYFLTQSSNSSEKAKKEGFFIYNGIDRIDSSLPHIIDNVVPCCYDCNRAKCDRLTKDFLLWATQLKITNFQPIIIPDIEFPGQPLSASIKSIYYGYKKDTDLSIEKFYAFSQMNCFYCESAPNNFFDRGKSDKKASEKTKQIGSFYYNGLDRIDRSLPHNKNNIVPCCYWCNFAKGKLTLPEFQTWIKRIQQFQKTK